MLFPHVVSTEADKAFINVLNVQAATADAGDALVWDTGTSNGVRVTQPVTGTLSLFVGVADSAIAASAYGLVQAYGYRASALIAGDTSITIAVGDILVPVNAADYVSYSKTSTGLDGFIYNGASYGTVSTPASVASLAAVFIRAL